MPKDSKKKYLDVNVYEKAKERIRYLFDNWETVVVSFSGGKDSTALLLCCVEVAKEMGKLPVRAYFYDEEALHPPTIEYMHRVNEMPEVDLVWYCLPVQHRNACSNEQPFWHCWHPDEKEIWCRDMPDCAVTEHPRFKFGMSMQDFAAVHHKNTNVINLMGIRTEESMRRYRLVTKKTHENYVTKSESGVYNAFPIYDWDSDDVWRLVALKGADYNKTYDVYNRTSLHEKFLHQRVCPPYGEEPLRNLQFYAECWPELWAKMINRVKGASTAARYGNTELYSNSKKPENVDWRTHINNILITFGEKDRAAVSKNINMAIKTHKRLTGEPIPLEQPHPLSGLSWKFIGKMALRGDFKGRIIGMLPNEKYKALAKLNISGKEQADLLQKEIGRK